MPGDIVIFPRALSNRLNLDELRSDKNRFAPTHSAIVYTVDGDKFSVISANVRNAVRLIDHSLNEKIVGFVRLSDSK